VDEHLPGWDGLGRGGRILGGHRVFLDCHHLPNGNLILRRRVRLLLDAAPSRPVRLAPRLDKFSDMKRPGPSVYANRKAWSAFQLRFEFV
jgi:hypothetical protein